MNMRLNRFMALCGVASRRNSDNLIQKGKVLINGNICYKLSTIINPIKDKVFYNQKCLKLPKKLSYYVFYKPLGCLTTSIDPFNRQTIYNFLSKVSSKKVFHVGRLDFNTEGLLFLMNDGQLAYRLLHPKYQVSKIYYVELNSYINSFHLDLLKKGILMEEGLAKAENIIILKNLSNSSKIKLTLNQGFKRQIKRMFEYINLKVLYLRRESFAEINLDKLSKGECRKMTFKEIFKLKKQVNLI